MSFYRIVFYRRLKTMSYCRILASKSGGAGGSGPLTNVKLILSGGAGGGSPLTNANVALRGGAGGIRPLESNQGVPLQGCSGPRGSPPFGEKYI
jgi:hypothetical protein